MATIGDALRPSPAPDKKLMKAALKETERATKLENERRKQKNSNYQRG